MIVRYKGSSGVHILFSPLIPLPIYSEAMQRKYEQHGFFRFTGDATTSRDLWCLKPGETAACTVCRVLEVAKRAIHTQAGRSREILHGIVADTTAKVPFLSAVEREAPVKDSVVLVTNAEVKRRNGLPTLYFTEETSLQVLTTETEFPPAGDLLKPRRRTVGDAIRCGGAFDIVVEGTIVSNLADAPEQRVVLDDGTGAVYLLLPENMRDQSVYFGMPVRVRGNVVPGRDAYALIVTSVKAETEASLLPEMNSFLCRYT